MDPKDKIKLHFPLPIVKQYEAMSLVSQPQLHGHKPVEATLWVDGHATKPIV